jgi:hypothetical protein
VCVALYLCVPTDAIAYRVVLFRRRGPPGLLLAALGWAAVPGKSQPPMSASTVHTSAARHVPRVCCGGTCVAVSRTRLHVAKAMLRRGASQLHHLASIVHHLLRRKNTWRSRARQTRTRPWISAYRVCFQALEDVRPSCTCPRQRGWAHVPEAAWMGAYVQDLGVSLSSPTTRFGQIASAAGSQVRFSSRPLQARGCRRRLKQAT